MNSEQLEQFQCRCGCAAVEPVPELSDLVELLEMTYGTVIITSGYRCPEHNARVAGASPKSQHALRKAADVFVPGRTPAEVYYFLDETFPDRFGFGLYRGHVHIDVRGYRARWGLEVRS